MEILALVILDIYVIFKCSNDAVQTLSPHINFKKIYQQLHPQKT